nr:hypothetical protein pmam_308 [Pithovirus mammoth]
MKSLFSLSLLSLSLQEVLEICSSGSFPRCDGIWAEKAEKEFCFPRSFFELHQGGQTSSSRLIPSSFRYLELISSKTFLPELAVSVDKKSGQISGLYESLIGVKEAVIKGDEQQLEFFCRRMKPEFQKQLISNLQQGWFLDLLFPWGGPLIHLQTLQKLLNLGGSYAPLNHSSHPQIFTWYQNQTKCSCSYYFYFNQQILAETTTFKQVLKNNETSAYKLNIFFLMVEKGNETVFHFLDSFKHKMEKKDKLRFFHSVLRSGRMDFFQLFVPLLDELFPSEHEIFVEEFEYVFFGSNPQMLELLSQRLKMDEAERETYTTDLIQSAIEGYFAHHNLSGTYQILSQFSFSWYDLELKDLHFSGVPIDIIDLLYCKSDFPSCNKAKFLFRVLTENLGYLNVVFFCLSHLEGRILEPDFLEQCDQSKLEFHLKNFEGLTPLSVSIVRSTLQRWNLRIPPPLV